MTSSTLPTIVTILVAGLSGSVVVELIRAFRHRKKDALELFYPTWEAEMQRRNANDLRLQEEMRLLRYTIVALTEELAKLGGDPLAVRARVEEQFFQDR